ncbi:Zinc finger protein [Trichinella pseudospiralis]
MSVGKSCTVYRSRENERDLAHEHNDREWSHFYTRHRPLKRNVTVGMMRSQDQTMPLFIIYSMPELYAAAVDGSSKWKWVSGFCLINAQLIQSRLHSIPFCACESTTKKFG